MTIVEYRKELERRKEFHKLIMNLMKQHNLKEEEAIRFYYERIEPIYENDKTTSKQTD